MQEEFEPEFMLDEEEEEAELDNSATGEGADEDLESDDEVKKVDPLADEDELI